MKVGDCLNQHFVATYQKVGSFQLVNGQKQGGNVASYFCTANGGVLEAVAGPVDAATLLREARWVVETRKMALLESHNDMQRYKQFFRLAHAEQLASVPGVNTVNWQSLPWYPPTEPALGALLDGPAAAKLDQPGKVHLLLALYPLVPLDVAYKPIYEKVVGEKISTRPVSEDGTTPADSGPSLLTTTLPAQNPLVPQRAPTADELRAQSQALALARARNDPPANEVYGASAPNTLLADLEKLQAQGATIRSAPLTSDVLAHLTLTSETDTGTSARVKLGDKLSWPLPWHDALLWGPSATLRASVEGRFAEAVAQARKGQVDADLLAKLNSDVKELGALVQENINRLDASTAIGAKRYLGELDASLKVLQRSDAARYVDGTFTLDAGRIKTVADLVAFMRQNGLKFAPAVAGDEPAYRALQTALAACDKDDAPQTTTVAVKPGDM